MNQKLHFADEQLFTTFEGRPEALVATTRPVGAGETDLNLLAEVCKRFNAHEELVALLGAYVEDDENNKETDNELYIAAVDLLGRLK